MAMKKYDEIHGRSFRSHKKEWKLMTENGQVGFFYGVWRFFDQREMTGLQKHLIEYIGEPDESCEEIIDFLLAKKGKMLNSEPYIGKEGTFADYNQLSTRCERPPVEEQTGEEYYLMEWFDRK